MARRVAEMAGVSLPMVYEAMRPGGGRVAETTRERILSAAQQIGYRPSWGARAVRRQRTDHVGIVNSTHYVLFTAGIYPLIFNDLTRLLAGHDLSCQLVFDQGSNPKAIEPVSDRRFDGALVLHELSPEVRQAATVTGLPLVLINAVDPLGIYDQVIPDDEAGASMATRHLLELGHRRIALVLGHNPGLQHFSVPRRETGYRKTMQEAGLTPMVLHLQLDGKEHAGEVVLSCSPQPTAIIVTDDRVAFLMLQDFWRRGVSVPEMFSVVAFNDTLLTQGSVPDLTAVHIPTREMSEAGVEMLLPKLRGRPGAEMHAPGAHPRVERVIPQRLVVRGSTAPPGRRN